MSPFDIIHSDVLGPSHVSSTLGSNIMSLSLMISLNAPRYLINCLTGYLISLKSNVFKYSDVWGDANLTACYLINRMPSSILGNEIPYSHLFPKDPMYIVPLRVFGSTCFVHDLSIGCDKLSAQAVKCVFLGYSKTQKGYSCYYPSTHCFYVSADVTFFEDKPFFALPTTSGSTTDVTTSQVMPIPLFEPFVSTQNPSQSQGNPELRRYGITYERRHVETPKTTH
jgi:hypothetical protein